MPAQYGISDILRLYGTDFDYSKACLIVIPRIAYRSQVLTGDRWLAILKKSRGMSDCFSEGNLSYGDSTKVNILDGGYYPIGGLGLVFVIVVLLLLMGRI
jgi:hypothetical protein